MSTRQKQSGICGLFMTAGLAFVLRSCGGDSLGAKGGQIARRVTGFPWGRAAHGPASGHPPRWPSAGARDHAWPSSPQTRPTDFSSRNVRRIPVACTLVHAVRALRERPQYNLKWGRRIASLPERVFRAFQDNKMSKRARPKFATAPPDRECAELIRADTVEQAIHDMGTDHG